MNLTFDVIIATYNRHQKVNRLCEQIKECSIQPEKLIVIDSSDDTNEELKNDPGIVYRKASHKSQPYQRYVGTLVSEADILIFFDDDLVINDLKLFERITGLFKNNDITGVGLGIEYHNIISTQLIPSKPSLLNRLKRTFSAKRKPEAGSMSLFGETGGLPNETVETMYLPGPNMSFRRTAVTGIFDDILFALFEHRIGMGEDKVLSMRVAKKGKLIYSGEKNYLLHPAEESSYFSNAVNFYAKVYYSRLWLANQYASLWKVPFVGLRKLLYLLKTLMTATSKHKVSAFIQTLSWIKKYGWNQQFVNPANINYQQQALSDARKIII